MSTATTSASNKQPTGDAAEPFEVNAENMRVLLANRIMTHSRAIDALREQQPHNPGEYAAIATGIAESLAVIEELQQIWEAAFDEFPSMLDVGQAATI